MSPVISLFGDFAVADGRRGVKEQNGVTAMLAFNLIGK
jgi:hypothetical protein